MRTISLTITHNNVDGPWSVPLNSAVITGRRNGNIVVGPSAAAIAPAGANTYHTISIDVPDALASGDIDVTVDPWYLNSVLQQPITTTEDLPSAAPLILVTRTTSVVNPLSPLVMFAGETARAVNGLASDVPFAYAGSAVLICNGEDGLPATPFSGDPATIADDGTGHTLCTYGFSERDATPPAGLYKLRFRITLVGDGAVVDTPAYLLRVLPG